MQNFGCYECYIQLQRNGEVTIMNKRIIENPRYVLEQDPLEVQRIREQHEEDELERSKQDPSQAPDDKGFIEGIHY